MVNVGKCIHQIRSFKICDSGSAEAGYVIVKEGRSLKFRINDDSHSTDNDTFLTVIIC